MLSCRIIWTKSKTFLTTLQTKRLLFRDKKRRLLQLNRHLDVRQNLGKNFTLSTTNQFKIVPTASHTVNSCLLSPPPYRSCALVAPHSERQTPKLLQWPCGPSAPLTQAIWAVSRYFFHQTSNLLKIAVRDGDDSWHNRTLKMQSGSSAQWRLVRKVRKTQRFWHYGVRFNLSRVFLLFFTFLFGSRILSSWS